MVAAPHGRSGGEVITALLVSIAVWLWVPTGRLGAEGPRIFALRFSARPRFVLARDLVLVGAAGLSLGLVAAAAAACVLRLVLPRLAVPLVDAATLDVDAVIVSCDYLAVCATAGLTIVDSLAELAMAQAGPSSSWAKEAVARHRAGMPLPEALRVNGHPSADELRRVLLRAHATGAPVAQRLRRQSHALRRERRDSTVRSVRALGVRAVAPLGLCFLPAFVLLAVVPLAASFAAQLTW